MSFAVCPECGSRRSKVLNTVPTNHPFRTVSRRRECENKHRYTTFEAPANQDLRNFIDVSDLPKEYRAFVKKVIKDLREKSTWIRRKS